MAQSLNPPLPSGWTERLGDVFSLPPLNQLRAFLRAEYRQGRIIYPNRDNYFRAFELTDLSQVKVVILGQDPYHGPAQAHGLCFSVQPPTPPPPSLINIFKELKRDFGLPLPRHGDLTSWAQQGVLLLNTVLTVEQGRPASHAGKGWETFTDRAIEVVNQFASPSVFLLWGSHAHKKAEKITNSGHLILKAPHPSPLSAHRGFLGCGHFSKANAFLVQQGRSPVNWALPDSQLKSPKSTLTMNREVTG